MSAAASRRSRRSGALAVAAVACLSLAGACRSPGDDGATGNAGGPRAPGSPDRRDVPVGSAVPAAFSLTPPARLLGSTVDAATGARLSGVRVWAGDAEVTSDAQGRFALHVTAGWSGPLLGETEDGRTARLELRPLAPGPLEVVLRLVRP
ncbi:MAG: hypothetical protein GC161_05200 [Planctomycetaceae bacterium]|nr:hypothetical protein [Planctomycetaceae bacterium]